MLVKSAMKKNFFTISPKANLLEAATLMVKEGVSTLFVIGESQLIGVIGIRDLFTCPIPASFGQSMPAHTEKSLIQQWENTPVENMMVQDVVSVMEDSSLISAAAIMVNTGKHPLVVKNGGEFAGVIDRVDIIKALLELRQTTNGR